MKHHRQPRAHLGGMMLLLWFLNSFQALSRQKASMLEWLTATERVTHCVRCLNLCLLQVPRPSALCQDTTVRAESLPGPALRPGIWYSHQFHILPIFVCLILNSKYFVSILDRAKLDNLDNCRLLNPTWYQRKIMKHLIQNAAKKKVMEGVVMSNSVRLCRRTEFLKHLLHFLRKIQFSVKKAIYLAFCRVFDLLVLIKEIR